MSERDEKREGKVEDNLIEIPKEGWFDPEFGVGSEGEDIESSTDPSSNQEFGLNDQEIPLDSSEAPLDSSEISFDSSEVPQSRIKSNKQKIL